MYCGQRPREKVATKKNVISDYFPGLLESGAKKSSNFQTDFFEMKLNIYRQRKTLELQ
jgi:hypothetical protein